MPPFVRTALLGAASLAATAASVHAAPAVVTSGSLVDAGSDGRMVLTYDKLVDRQSGASDDLTFFKSRGVDLADTARKALITPTETTGDRSLTLYNLERTGANDLLLAANRGPDGTPVPWGGNAKLVRNGQTVVFDTAEPTPRIIAFTFGEPSGTVLLTGAQLVDASEDGKVITYRRELPAESRPSGQAMIGGDRAGLVGTAVGYLVRGQEPRIVAKSKLVQSYVVGYETGACGARSTEWTSVNPSGLTISQRGDGSYALYLSAWRATDPYGSTRTLERVTATGTTPLADAGNPAGQIDLFADPVSGAYALVKTTKSNGPVLNTPTLVGADGAIRALGTVPVPGAGGSYDDSGFYTRIVPIGSGTGAIYSASPVTRDSFLSRPTVYVNEGAPLGAPSGATAWLTLPRTGDVVDTNSIRTDITWEQCDDAPVAGTIADYLAFAPRTTGNSAGSLTLTTGPEGFIEAISLRATISWLGLPLWRGTLERDGVLRLPAIPAGFGGFKVTAAVKLYDGTVLTQSAPLRRTR
jgi:hypothetical protein